MFVHITFKLSSGCTNLSFRVREGLKLTIKSLAIAITAFPFAIISAIPLPLHFRLKPLADHQCFCNIVPLQYMCLSASLVFKQTIHVSFSTLLIVTATDISVSHLPSPPPNECFAVIR